MLNDNLTRPQGPNVPLIGQPGSRHQLQTPALILDLDALEANVGEMARFAKQTGVGLRPHAKTHKSLRVARMQLDAGANGICVATVGEAQTMVKGGIPGVLITTPVVGEAKIGRLWALNALGQNLTVVIDHPQNLVELAQAMQQAPTPLEAAVALDGGLQRIGAATVEEALELAKGIAAAPGLTFAGIHCYDGGLQHIADYDQRVAQAAVIQGRIATLKKMIEAEGIDVPMVTGAGTGTHEIDGGSGVYTEMQTGSYVFCDVEYNAVNLRQSNPRPFRNALFVQTMVVSASHAGFVTTDGGIKRFATGTALPVVVDGAPEGSTYQFMGDEHGRLIVPDGAPKPELGARMELLTPHCDPTVNLYDVYHVVRGDTLVDIWPVDARGAI